MSKRSRERKEKRLEERKEFEYAVKERRRGELAWVRRALKWTGLGIGAGTVILLLVWGGIKLFGYISDNFGDIKGPFGQISREELAQNKFATLVTSEGEMKIELDIKNTPKTAANFILLAQKDFYNGVKFHRVVKDFMIQTGDPNSKDNDPSNDGTGGPGYTFDDEKLGGIGYTRGTVAMANSGANTNGSQFFIMHADNELQPSYVIFGHLVEGFDTLDKIAETSVEDNGTGELSRPKEDIIVETVILSDE